MPEPKIEFCENTLKSNRVTTNYHKTVYMLSFVDTCTDIVLLYADKINLLGLTNTHHYVAKHCLARTLYLILSYFLFHIIKNEFE